MSRDPSVIPAAVARAEAAKQHRTIEQYMLDLLPVARAFARPPISAFAVGAVAQGTSGALYLGANLEFPGVPLSESVHAEQAAVANAWIHDETGISAIAVTAAPCGYCRQFLNELTTAGSLRVFVKDATEATLAALLPAAFGPRDLGIDGGLMDRTSAGLSLADAARDLGVASPRDLVVAGPPLDRVVDAALAAADASYAPYSKSYGGVALATADGTIHTGRYAENAAFNPSMSPLQGALARLALTRTPYEAIVRAVLVETDGPVRRKAATEALLAAVAPDIPLTYLRANRAG